MVTLEISAWAAGGRGVARSDGRVVLVSGGVPGDRARVRIVRDHGRWLEGRVTELADSRGRRPVPCALQPECGGCPMMPVPEADQRQAKRRFLLDALARIGRLPGVPVDEVVPAPAPLGYRNKVELTFGRSREGRPVLGYHRGDDPRSILDVPACAIAHPRLAPALALAREFFAGAEVVGELRVVLRCSDPGAEVLVALRGGEEIREAAVAFARRAGAELAGLAGVAWVTSRPGGRGGATTRALAGRAAIEERLLDIPFALPAATFFQVNTPAAEGMARHVLDGAGACDTAVELYAGVGAIGLALARRGARVDLVEADADAVSCGRDAAARAGISGARFIRGDVATLVAGLRRGGEPADLVVADPPRTGLGRGVAEGIAALGPRRLAMISCDPATLARDLAALGRLGFTADRVVPFDLFPQTAHVEAVAWLAGPSRIRDARGGAAPARPRPPRGRSRRRASG